MVTYEPRRPRIAIIGAGVCGITCAVALAKNGINAHIYEAKSKYGEIGAGIGIGANALKIMKDLGVYNDLLACTPEPGECNIKGFRYVFGSNNHDEILRLPAGPEEDGIAIHRATFLSILVKQLDPQYTQFDKRCIDIIHAEDPLVSSTTIRFDDGTTVEADVVLIANGVKSRLRPLVTGREDNAVFSTNTCFRGLVPQEEILARNIDTSHWKVPAVAVGKNKSVVIYPINGGAMLNIAALIAKYQYPIGHPEVARDASAPTLEVVSNEELLSHFEDYGPNLRSILECIARPNKWYINVIHPHLPSFVKGRVALLGDAAHAMVPHIYAGAGQGMEDGYLLARLLSYPQTTLANVESVLKAYDEIRRPRSQRVWDQSLEAGKVVSGLGSSGFTKEGIVSDLTGIMDYINSYQLGDDVAQAEAMLRKRDVWV